MLVRVSSSGGAVEPDGVSVVGGAPDGEREMTSPKLSADFSAAEGVVRDFWPIGCYAL